MFVSFDRSVWQFFLPIFEVSSTIHISTSTYHNLYCLHLVPLVSLLVLTHV